MRDNEIITDNEILRAWDFSKMVAINIGSVTLGKSEVVAINGLLNRQMSNIEELKIKNSNLISDLSSAKAEIERLKAPKFIIEQKPLSEKEMREALKYASLGVIIDGETTIKRIDEEGIKAEAVKEFAERLVYTLCINNEENTEMFDYAYTLETIDNIAKELTEGKKK